MFLRIINTTKIMKGKRYEIEKNHKTFDFGIRRNDFGVNSGQRCFYR